MSPLHFLDARPPAIEKLNYQFSWTISLWICFCLDISNKVETLTSGKYNLSKLGLVSSQLIFFCFDAVMLLCCQGKWFQHCYVYFFIEMAGLISSDNSCTIGSCCEFYLYGTNSSAVRIKEVKSLFSIVGYQWSKWTGSSRLYVNY